MVRVIQTIRRFRAQQTNKTYRVYCYEENALGFPHRFEKKLRECSADNDVATDDEEVEFRVRQGLATLIEAIKLQN